MPRTVLRDCRLPDGERADIAIEGDRIAAVGKGSGGLQRRDDDTSIDSGGRVAMPGFIDAHCHADASIFDAEVQRGFLRQGITTAVAGQDGVSFAPGDGTYGTDYFGGLNGAHPSYGGNLDATVADLLRTYELSTPVNVAYLVPLGTVRHVVMGYAPGRADTEQLAAMQRLIAQGLSDGAVGVSSGLDYVPGIHSDTDELIELCKPAGEVGSLYVTHMRGGYEEYAQVGTDEVTAIARGASVAAHISHYHGDAAPLTALIDGMRRAGVDVTYDAYFYRRSCTLVSMVTLPPDLVSQDKPVVAAMLRETSTRDYLLRDWFPAHEAVSPFRSDWPHLVTFAHVPSPDHEWAHGMTVQAAAERAGLDPREFVLDVLAATELNTTGVMRVRNTRTHDDMVPLFTHPAFVGGSDGISLGRHPHPRAYGAFARFLRILVRENEAWTWADAAEHLSGLPAARFGLGDRGAIAVGKVADLSLVDPGSVADAATYDDPRAPATGIDDVWVSGAHVLRGGELTGSNAGRAVHRTNMTPAAGNGGRNNNDDKETIR